ncbi:Myxococcus xanthus double-CXXCG motif paralogous family [Myxococcus fulvus]|uniref:Myxococcus xanthus double-CXXCG motif paralogous family n=1 Tax=Myxococcus fulvus TaxID=33 RepID=A0A511SZ44_MYXFU|nr:double-CXXCG motif protein [Myxococcus fulvus]GEN07159.1 hypothetical protein MFU01_21960 [Myxococcus fulvus]SET98799.1 Myxococcus xanthus double-CXXCG motif paralogous family [Myxococcus fulvus]
MQRYFIVEEDRVAAARQGGMVDASHRWGLPGLLTCPGCGVTWSGAGQYLPSVDLSELAESASFERARPEPYGEFVRLRALVLPLAPPGVELSPGAEFGPLVGRVTGGVPDFTWVAGDGLLVQREALARLQEVGVRGLHGYPTALRARKKVAPDLRELELPLLGRLHPDCLPPALPAKCTTCGRVEWALPEHPILAADSLPTDVDLFRVGDFATVVIGTERFVDAVKELGLEGLALRDVPAR